MILPNFNGKNLLELYLPHTYCALQNSSCPYEIIVVDDGSKDDSVSWLRKNHPDILLIQNSENLGFSKSCNQGIAMAKGDLVLLLNTDVRLSPDYLNALLPYFNNPNTFGVMGKIWDSSGKKVEMEAKIPSFNGFKLKSNPLKINPKDGQKQIPTLFLSGANCLLDRKKLLELNGFDEIYSPFYSEDLDLSFRAWRLGWNCYYEPGATCFHLGSHTTKTFFQKAFVKQIYFRNRMLFHAIHVNRKDLKRWELSVFFLQVLPKILLGQFWIIKSFRGYRIKKKEVKISRRKIRKLMGCNKGRISILEVTQEIQRKLDQLDLTYSK